MTHNPSHFRLNPNIMPQFQIKIDEKSEKKKILKNEVSKTKNLTKEKNIYKIQVGEKKTIK